MLPNIVFNVGRRKVHCYVVMTLVEPRPSSTGLAALFFLARRHMACTSSPSGTMLRLSSMHTDSCSNKHVRDNSDGMTHTQLVNDTNVHLNLNYHYQEGVSRPNFELLHRHRDYQYHRHASSTSMINNNRPREKRMSRSRLNFQCHYYSTSLYTTPAEAESVPFAMKPAFDFKQLLHEDNVALLNQSISDRKMKIDLNKVIYLWNKVKDIEENTEFLKSARKKLKMERKLLNKQENAPDSTRTHSEGKRIRENLKKATAIYNSISEELYILALQLPNILHPNTPRGIDGTILQVHGDKPDNATRSHVEIGTEQGLLTHNHDLVHPGTCYLHDKAAWLERALQWWVSQTLVENGFTMFSSPDMFKPAPLEALGIDVQNPNKVLSVLTSESNLYLTGVSAAAFTAYYMMSVIEDSELPHRSFSVGTHYDANKDSISFTGLPEMSQRNQIELGCVCRASSESDAVFNQIISLLRDLYSQLPVHFRIVEVGTEGLLPSMYRKQSIQLLLPSTQRYYEVASIYNCTDYVTRRLRIRYPAHPRQTAALSRERLYPHTLHGTAVDISVLLAVLLEVCQTKDQSLEIPSALRNFLPQTS